MKIHPLEKGLGPFVPFLFLPGEKQRRRILREAVPTYDPIMHGPDRARDS